MATYTSIHTGANIDKAVTNANQLLLSGSGDPTTSTVGTVGQTYKNTTSGALFRCTAAVGGVYTWINATTAAGISIVDAAGLYAANETEAALAEAMTKINTNNQYKLPQYDHARQEYVNLDKFWDVLRNGKKYTTEFNQFSVSPNPTGTKKDDNAGLVMVPSTNTVAGKDDYAKIGLFMPIEVNAYVDSNDDYHVTAIKGDALFKRDGTMGDVYIMNMVGYRKYETNATTWRISYSDTMHPGYEILDEAIKPDGTVRPYLLHAKYIAGINPLDGKLSSISGVNPTYSNMSHNGQISQFLSKGAQYSGKTSHDDFWVQMIFWIKYATTHSQSIMAGAQSTYYLQYNNLVAEISIKRVVVTNAQADSLLVGSCVSIGDYNGSAKSTDRNSSLNTNIANRVKIISIEDIGGGNSAVNVDVAVAFNTTLTTTITTYPWQSGSCDSVLGVDGSPTDNLSGKEPFIINGIEMMVGGYEVLQNLIIYNNNTNTGDYKIQTYACYDCKNYATSPTANYDLLGQTLAKTNGGWMYISAISIDPDHPTVMLATEAVASSTTGFADGIYTQAPATGYRGWLSLGALSYAAYTGLRCLLAFNGLSISAWSVLGRLSATGRSRRRAGVN